MARHMSILAAFFDSAAIYLSPKSAEHACLDFCGSHITSVLAVVAVVVVGEALVVAELGDMVV